MSLKIQSTRKLILAMTLVVIAGFLLARKYYGQINKAADPRVAEARSLYGNYNRVAQSGDYHALFHLLDRIDSVYLAQPHYAASFERGVVENNRAAALLTLALYGDSIPDSRNPWYYLESDSLIALSRKHVLCAMQIYEQWGWVYQGLDVEEIEEKIGPDFVKGLDPGGADPVKVTRQRALEIHTAMKENHRRLSVCHTNMGVICRNEGRHEEAVGHYEKALELWDRNLEAENNLNRILGLPLKKRNLIQKLFPPPKDAL